MMLNPEEELIGQPVLVHPRLTGDPAGKTGQVGIITGTELENDNIYVGFGRRGHGLYGTDALLMLKPLEQIQQNFEAHKNELSTAEFKALFQISLLKSFAQSPANIKTAMSLALTSETVRNLSMRTVEDAMGLSRNPYVER